MPYTPGEQADPAFLKFFAEDFQKRLEGIEIPGMDGASWDRRAAYLLWLAEGNDPQWVPLGNRMIPARSKSAPPITEDDFGGLV